VADLGILTAGAAASAILADLGADVIKLESKSRPDPFRFWAEAKDEDSPFFRLNNRNKRGVDIDLKSEEGRKLFLALTAKVDVVVENFSRGVLERLGIGFEVLREVNPRIILASVTGQGLTGPGSDYVSYGCTLEAVGGISAVTGYPCEQPIISGRNLNYPDQVVSLFAAGAIIVALMNARQTGQPVHLDVSQRQTTTFVLGEYLALASLVKGLDDSEFRRGNRGNHELLQGAFLTGDGQWLTVSLSTEEQLVGLSRVLGLDRTTPVEEMEKTLAQWVSARPLEPAQQALLAAGLPVYPVLDGAQAAESEAVRLGTSLVCAPDGSMYKGFPFQLRHQPLTVYSESPKLGEHTDEVLAEWLDN
jgi:crotonobetainyl-CoA:carnitine CoA-transferase CaiB-like acyl-CoA transferase